MDTSARTIVVAVDDSSASQRAVDVALALAGSGQTLNFVHAVDTISALIPVAEGSLIDTAPLLEHLAKEAQMLCDTAVEKARKRDRAATSTALRSHQSLRLVHVRGANESYAMPVFVALLCREAVDAGVALEMSLVGGATADGIVADADAHNCSSIVMGTHGRNALQRIVQHSIAYSVIETAKVPVTVVRALPESEKIAATALAARSIHSADFPALPISM